MKRILTPLLLLSGLLTGTLTYGQDNIVLKNGTEIKAKVLEVSATQIKYRKQDNLDGPVYTSGVGEVLLINYANGTKDVLNRSATGQPSVQAPLLAPLLSPAQNASGQSRPSIDGLRYEGGWFNRHFTTQSGESLSNREVRSLLYTQPDALHSFEQGQHLRRWGYLAGGTALALMGAGAIVAAVGNGGFGHDGSRGGNDGTLGTMTDFDGNSLNKNDHSGGDGAAIVGVSIVGTGVLVGITALLLDHRATVAFRRAADRYHPQPATSLHLTPGYRGTGIGLALRF